jgi:hypothetical protein
MATNAQFKFFGDRRYRFLKHLFKEWHRLLGDFERVLRGYHDIPYWHRERTNVGILASASILLSKRTMALQEINVRRRKATGRSGGRADLWIRDTTGSRSYDFEFKVMNRSLGSTRTGNFKRTLAGAVRDVRSLPKPEDPSWGIALVFVIPHLPRVPDRGEEDGLWDRLVGSFAKPKALGADFAAIHRAPRKVVAALARNVAKAGWNPGIAAVGKIVRR